MSALEDDKQKVGVILDTIDSPLAAVLASLVPATVGPMAAIKALAEVVARMLEREEPQ